MNNKYPTLIAVAALLLSTSCLAAATSPSSPKSCPQNAADNALTEQLYQSGLAADTLITLLYGNTATAIDSLGNELATDVLVLNSISQHPECGVSKEAIAHIYPMLRVIAAINHTKPIPKINDNKKVMAILDQVIKANPDHYQQLLHRAKHWQHGIN